MARTPIQITKQDVEEAIASAENGVALSTRTEVFEKACQFLFNKNIRCSPAFIYLKCKEYGIAMITPPGKRGRAAKDPTATDGVMARPMAKKESRKIQLNSEVAQSAFSKMEEHILSYFPKETSTVAKIKNGNIRAMVRANCLLCRPDGKQAVADCTTQRCSFWNVRPFQHKHIMVTVGMTDKSSITDQPKASPISKEIPDDIVIELIAEDIAEEIVEETDHVEEIVGQTG